MVVLGFLLGAVGVIVWLVGLVMMFIKKTKVKGIKIFFTGFVVIFAGLGLMMAGNSADRKEANEEPASEEASSKPTEEVASKPTNVDKPITLAQYESVQIGDSQDKIKKELGKVSKGNIDEDGDDNIMWSYSGKESGLAYVYFSKDDKKVIKKSEISVLKENSNTETTSNGTVDLNDWNSQVKKVAASDKTETEKFDEVTKLASEFLLTEQESKEFEDYIVNEYKTKNYLKDIGNDEYMLTNIFKATAVDKHYDDSEREPIDEFAFDFLQNTKYTYRGAEAVGSQFVLANEKQMNDSLAAMN